MPQQSTKKSIDRSSHEPLHRQLKQIIQNQIDSGKIPVNTKLPSERSLVATDGVSRITVRQALHAIVQEGHVQSQPGKGFYVTDHKPGPEFHLLKSFTTSAIERGRVPGSRLVLGTIAPTDPKIAKSLQLPADAPVLYLQRIRTLDGDPVIVQEDWLAPALAPGLLDLDWSEENKSLYHELRTRYGVYPQHGSTTLGARLATQVECDLLHLEDPSAVLTLSQIAYDADDRPVNVSKIIQDSVRHPTTLYQVDGAK